MLEGPRNRGAARDDEGASRACRSTSAAPSCSACRRRWRSRCEGEDLETIRKAGQRLAAMLRANPHYADVKSTVEQGFPEIQIRFDQDRAAALGLTTRQIADVVVNKVRGDVATRYSFRDRKIDVLVRAQESDRAFGGRHPPADRQSGQRHARSSWHRSPTWWRPPGPARSTAPTSVAWRSSRPTCATSTSAARSSEVQRHGARSSAGHRRRHAHRRPGRGAGRIDPVAAVRVRRWRSSWSTW